MLSRRRILLIEDEESIAEPLADALERDGFDVTTAPTMLSVVTQPTSRSPSATSALFTFGRVRSSAASRTLASDWRTRGSETSASRTITDRSLSR